jgi:hypothetical protein
MTTDETRAAIVAELRYMAQKLHDEADRTYGGACDGFGSAAVDLEKRAVAWENGQEWAEQRAELAAKLAAAQTVLARFDAAHPDVEGTA